MIKVWLKSAWMCVSIHGNVRSHKVGVAHGDRIMDSSTVLEKNPTYPGSYLAVSYT